jgi:hypothetical protein
MKLAALYNVWDGVELLHGSINCIKDHVDQIIIVWQNVSNIGEAYDPMPEMDFHFEIRKKIIFYKYEPNFSIRPAQNEVKKRNAGLDIAYNYNCTHFFHIDVDEYYQDFAAAKKEYLISGCKGSVCRIYTYFKEPTLRLENLDGYYVPFIHELEEETRSGNSSYPFYCDPTRTISYSDRLHRDDIFEMNHPMHHFSWVRKDIGMKARNSSAAQYGNQLKGLLNDYHSPNLGDGYILKDMGGQRLKIVDNIFGID